MKTIGEGDHHVYVGNTMDRFVLPALASCATIAVTSDMWMSRTGVDTSCLVVNFMDSDWELRHITVGIFEA